MYVYLLPVLIHLGVVALICSGSYPVHPLFVFEIPVISWLLARLGLLKAEWMSRYRRHAIVVILTATAIITPTTDVLSLIIVSLPIWLLYEGSILLVKISEK